MEPLGLRMIVESASWNESIAAMPLLRRELDELLAGVMFAVARTPEAFQFDPDSSLCLARFSGSPAMNIWFTYSADYVTLLYVEEQPS